MSLGGPMTNKSIDSIFIVIFYIIAFIYVVACAFDAIDYRKSNIKK